MTEAVLQITSPALHLRHLSPVARTERSGLRGLPAEPMVLLHGWGADSTVFNGFAESLTQHRDVILVDLPGFGGSEPWPHLQLAALLDALSAQLPERFSLLGWSLGGMVATAFCDRFPERVSHLITLAANARFVAGDNWPTAMPPKTFRQFCGFFDKSPEACLKQFVGLETQGDSRQRQLLKALRLLPADTNSNWNRALALLGEIDNRAALVNLLVPGLHLFGENDALVPAAAAADIAALNAGQKVAVLAGAGHALHLSVPEQLVEKIECFLRGDDASAQRLDKRQVAESFSRAAKSYDGAAAFQRQIADRVLAGIPAGVACGQVLDVGCGTGYLSAGVRNAFPDAQLTALDLAPGMLAYAQAQRPVADRWVCGDAESLPLPSQSVDLVVSSLAYQWCEYPEQWGGELRRVLTSGGTAVFSTFGPNTLAELRSAWQSVDNFVHVNRFIGVEELRDRLSAAGLRFQLTVEQHCLRYLDLKTLMRELKAIGAHNVNNGRHAGLTGRERLRQLVAAYERFRDSDGLLPASYEVVYGVATK